MRASGDSASPTQAPGTRAARLHAIKQDIADSLHQPELSVGLATRHGCTPRGLQRMFAATGTTFTEHVMTQRLARAHRMLSDPRRYGEKIATIAYDVGFADLSYFNRVFRQRFGLAPSDVRAQTRDMPM